MPTIAERVLSGTAAVVTAAMTGVLNPVPAVAVRKRLYLLDAETPPLVIVAKAGDEETEPAWTDQTGKKWWYVKYKVMAALARAAGGTAGTDTTTEQWRDVVWPALDDYRKLTVNGLAEANDTFVRGGPTYDAGPQGKQVNWSVLYVTVETLELR